MHQDPLNQAAVAADMDDAGALPVYVRKAMNNGLVTNNDPNVSVHISRMADAIVLRRATLSHGLRMEKSIICGIFKRIVQFRGHLEPQVDALLPPT